jgi:hypothetical protein
MSNKYNFIENQQKEDYYKYNDPNDDPKNQNFESPEKEEKEEKEEKQQKKTIEISDGLNVQEIYGRYNEKGELACPIPRPFDPKNGRPKLEPEMTMVINGKRRTGKTWIATMLLHMLKGYYPVVYVFTDTKMNCWYNQYVNTKHIFEGYDATKLRKILEEQKKRVMAWRNGKQDFNPYILIVWDDCVPKEMFHDPLFRDIYFKGRHFMIANIMTTQYYYLIPKNLRGNIDLVFSLIQDMKHQIEAIWEDVMGRRCDLNTFTQMFDRYTQDRGFLCFDQSKSDVPIPERVYFGKAYDPGVFFVGCKEAWKNNLIQLKSILEGRERVKARRKPDLSKVKIYGEEDIESDLPNPYLLLDNSYPAARDVDTDVSSARPVQPHVVQSIPHRNHFSAHKSTRELASVSSSSPRKRTRR